ncbi:MAG: hypothetical protein FD180_5206 [Planctomycetota bacterium]|nr:MAG: hypothetical protein FD180_5206 [Planctomycetota bacterium]
MGLLAAVTVAITTVLVAEKSIWAELEIATAVISGFLFAFFFVLLYRGVRVDRNERYALRWWPADSQDVVGSLDFGSPAADGLDLASGCLSEGIVAILAAVVASLVAAILLWLFANVFLLVAFPICVPLFVLFQRSVRFAIARGRQCRGQIGPSLKWAALSTLVSTVWLYLVLFGAHAIATWLKAGK